MYFIKIKPLFYVLYLVFFVLSCTKDKDFGKRAPKEIELIGNWRLVSIEYEDPNYEEKSEVKTKDLEEKVAKTYFPFQVL